MVFFITLAFIFVLEFLVLIIFVISLGGIAFIIARKIPALSEISSTVEKKPYLKEEIIRVAKIGASDLKKVSVKLAIHLVKKAKPAKLNKEVVGEEVKEHKVDREPDYWEKITK